jgi:hypothetical protein
MPPDAIHIDSEQKHEQLLHEFDALIEFRRQIYRVLPFAVATRSVQSAAAPKSESILVEAIQRAREVAATALLNDPQLARAIGQYLRNSARKFANIGKNKRSMRAHGPSQSEKALAAAVKKRHEAIRRQLAKIPPTIQKARAALEHDLRQQSDMDHPPDALCAFGLEARALFPESVTARREALLDGKLVEAAPSGWEPFWYTPYVRYCETFEPKDGRRFVLEQGGNVEDEFRQATLGLFRPPEFAHHSVFELPHILRQFWSYTRSRTLRHVLMPIAKRAIPIILQWQRPDGAWPSFDIPANRSATEQDLYADTEVTANAVIFLARYATPQECDMPFQRASPWLIKAQGEDGTWSMRGEHRGYPALTTLIVLDALRRLDVPLDHPSIVRGEAALLRLQQPTGHWYEEKGLWESHLTALAIEYFQARTERGVAQNAYLRSARMLLLKSEQLILSNDEGDAALATTAAYHGVEHFLYGCLLELNSDEPIFVDTRGTTIGLQQALGVMERLLKKIKKLETNSGLPYRTQLVHLGSRRDMFIHRAETISLNEAIGHVTICRSFVERWDLALLGARLCE